MTWQDLLFYLILARFRESIDFRMRCHFLISPALTFSFAQRRCDSSSLASLSGCSTPRTIKDIWATVHQRGACRPLRCWLWIRRNQAMRGLQGSWSRKVLRPWDTPCPWLGRERLSYCTSAISVGMCLEFLEMRNNFCF